MNKSIANQRLNTEFHRLFSQLLHRFEGNLSAPINLTRTEVSPDLRGAHIYFTVALSNQATKVLQELKNSKKQGKYRLAQQGKHRRLPDLIFHYDYAAQETAVVADIFASGEKKS